MNRMNLLLFLSILLSLVLSSGSHTGSEKSVSDTDLTTFPPETGSVLLNTGELSSLPDHVTTRANKSESEIVLRVLPPETEPVPPYIAAGFLPLPDSLTIGDTSYEIVERTSRPREMTSRLPSAYRFQKEFTVFSQQGTDLKIVLSWPGGTFNLKVIDPEENLVSETESSEPPIIVDLQTHSEGDWQIVVTAIQVDQPEAVSLIVGAFEPEDIDSDDVTNDIDNCPGTINPDQADTDVDGVGDVCDNCLTTANSDQTDRFPLDGPDGSGNGIGDACEMLPEDMDNDGIENVLDNCPYFSNPDQLDTDEDNEGDICDIDNDNDTVPNVTDNCPRHSNSDQEDYDNDGLGDACDDDRDGDNVLNSADVCAFTEPGLLVDPAGCTIEQLCPCEGPIGASGGWKNHGKYVSCTAKSAEHFVELGLISEAEKDAIVSEAAQSDCGDNK